MNWRDVQAALMDDYRNSRISGSPEDIATGKLQAFLQGCEHMLGCVAQRVKAEEEQQNAGTTESGRPDA